MVIKVEMSSSVPSLLPLKIRVNRNVALEAAATLARLLPIRMVERNSSGFSMSRASSMAFLSFFFARWVSLTRLTVSSEVSAEEKKALNMISRSKEQQ